MRHDPTLLNLRIQDRLEPNISWLQDRQRLNRGSLQRIVLDLATIVDGLAQSLGSKLEPTLVWFKGKLYLDDVCSWQIRRETPIVSWFQPRKSQGNGDMDSKEAWYGW